MTDGKKLDEGDLWEEYYTNLHRAYNAMRNAFRRSGITQDEIAAKLGVDKSLISRRLNGQENLTLKTLSFMGSALSCRLKIDYVPYEEVISSTDRNVYRLPSWDPSKEFESNSTGEYVVSPEHQAA